MLHVHSKIYLFCRWGSFLGSWQTIVMSATAIALVVTATVRMLKPSSRNVHFLFLCQSPFFGIRKSKPRNQNHVNFHPFKNKETNPNIFISKTKTMQMKQKSWKTKPLIKVRCRRESKRINFCRKMNNRSKRVKNLLR